MKIAACILLLTISLFSQNDAEYTDYLRKINEDADFAAQCEAENRANEIKEFGRVLPTIAGNCEWGGGGCPVSLVKPKYPNAAQGYGISGAVKVEIFVDDNGDTVYAKAVEGKKVFYKNAERAALNSRFRPTKLCEKKVWQRKFIVYNFVPR